MLKVLIGICAYNVEEYIEQCLRSAMEQTYKNLRIAVIDDGSVDGTGAVIDRLAAEDPRISVIHRKNEGHASGREKIVSMARKEAADAIYWLDSDDWILPQAVERNVGIMEETGADIVKTTIKPSDMKYTGTYSRDAYMRLLLPDTKIKANVIGCLIRTEAYRGVHHRTGLSNDDYYVFPLIVENINKIVVDTERNYCYRIVRPGSVTYEGRANFRGYYPRAVHRLSRYMRYRKKYPEECRTVLQQFTDNACMACLYAPKGEKKREDVVECIRKLEPDIMASGCISRYKKWLAGEILRDGIMLKAVAPVHKARGYIKTQRDRKAGRG